MARRPGRAAPRRSRALRGRWARAGCCFQVGVGPRGRALVAVKRRRCAGRRDAPRGAAPCTGLIATPDAHRWHLRVGPPRRLAKKNCVLVDRKIHAAHKAASSSSAAASSRRQRRRRRRRRLDEPHREPGAPRHVLPCPPLFLLLFAPCCFVSYHVPHSATAPFRNNVTHGALRRAASARVRGARRSSCRTRSIPVRGASSLGHVLAPALAHTRGGRPAHTGRAPTALPSVVLLLKMLPLLAAQLQPPCDASLPVKPPLRPLLRPLFIIS